LPENLLKILKLSPPQPINLSEWKKLAEKLDNLNATKKEPLHIALVGKYTNLSDAYTSVVNSIHHAALSIEERAVIDWIEASSLEPEALASNPEAYEQAWKVNVNSLFAYYS
jgi:CTP synthase